MKKLLMALAASIALTGAAEAAVISVDVAAHPFRAPGQPGLQTRAWKLQSGGAVEYTTGTAAFDTSLTTVDLFGLVHFDAPINADDLTPKAMSVDFTVGAVTKTISGVTYAVNDATTLPSTVGHAVADFDTTVLDFWTGSGHLLISLLDTTFGDNAQGVFTNGRPGFGKVTASYSFVAAIPVPAALPMGMGALALMGFVARRRKSKAA